eukprot:s112_g16.t1
MCFLSFLYFNAELSSPGKSSFPIADLPPEPGPSRKSWKDMEVTSCANGSPGGSPRTHGLGVIRLADFRGGVSCLLCWAGVNPTISIYFLSLIGSFHLHPLQLLAAMAMERERRRGSCA